MGSTPGFQPGDGRSNRSVRFVRVLLSDANAILKEKHYLGPSRRGWAWQDDLGLMVFANPSSRRLPQHQWIELVRWCLNPGANNGSRQWSRFVKWAKKELPAVTTVVSYSDPGVGHTGSLYRASNWWWAPTWLRLRPPPTGNGNWGEAGRVESVKDRWIFPLREDAERVIRLRIDDPALARRFPWAVYVEPGGVPYRRLVEDLL